MSERIRRKFLPLQILILVAVIYGIGSFSTSKPVSVVEAASVIYYTIDGSSIDFDCAGNPGCSTYITSGSLSLPITETTTIRYVAEDEFGNRGFEQVVTYTIGDEEEDAPEETLETEELATTVPTIVTTQEDPEETPELLPAAEPVEEAPAPERDPVVVERGELKPEIDLNSSMKRGPLAELIVKIFEMPLSDEMRRETLYENLELRQRTVFEDFSMNQFYADVPPTHDNYPFVQELTLQGIVRGRLESGNFEPDNTINKAELLAVVLNSSGMFGFDYDFLGKTYEWYEPYMLFAKGNDLIPEKYEPLEIASIGDADALLYNVLEARGDLNKESLKAASDPIELLKSKLNIHDSQALSYEEVIKILLLVRGFHSIDDLVDYIPTRNDLISLALPSNMGEYAMYRIPERHALIMLLNTMLSKHHVQTIDELIEQNLVPKEYFEERTDTSDFARPLEYMTQYDITRLKNLLFECYGIVAGFGPERDPLFHQGLVSVSHYCNTPARPDMSHNKRTCVNQCVRRLGDQQISKKRFGSEYTTFTDFMGETLKFFPEIVAELNLD